MKHRSILIYAKIVSERMYSSNGVLVNFDGELPGTRDMALVDFEEEYERP